MSRFRSIFPSRDKPLIAMVHLPPLPGTPMYESEGGVAAIIKSVKRDLALLRDAGFDAVLFCNEGDRPYTMHAGYSGVAVMTRVVTEAMPEDLPFGVDFLWDAEAALAIAIATGAHFMREVATGVYESDMGVLATDAAGLLRERRRLGGDEAAIFMNVTPEFASSLGNRDIPRFARSTVVSSLPDAVLVSGPMAGSEPDLDTVRAVKRAVGDQVPVLVNTGVKASTVAEYLSEADGVIVGSDLKENGYTWSPVDVERVKVFLKAAGR